MPEPTVTEADRAAARKFRRANPRHLRWIDSPAAADDALARPDEH